VIEQKVNRNSELGNTGLFMIIPRVKSLFKVLALILDLIFM